MSRRILVVSLALALIAAVVLLAVTQKGGKHRIVQRGREVEDALGKLTEPMRSSVRNFNPVSPNREKRERPRMVISEREHTLPRNEPAPVRSLTILAAEPQAAEPAPRGPKGDYAPAFRMLKCQLVNTVDSSDLTTPIIGLVAEDLWWNGCKIIPANSELHGIASVDPVRERIASEGEFTFVLNEADGRGRELVIRGMVLDMERDDEFDSYGITDGSAGLRGDVIRTSNIDVVKLYAASLLSGISTVAGGIANGIFGSRIYTNSNAIGLGALQGGVINPTVGGTQAMLDRYTQQIQHAIERDGFFVRVPAGKQFYVYCTEAIDLSRAKIAADDERLAREEAEFNKQRARQEVRRAMPVDPSELLSPLLPALGRIKQNTK
jgi:Bacterial conjugation TrbI-like protein